MLSQVLCLFHLTSHKRNTIILGVIKFCVKRQGNATETFNKLKQAYGDESMSHAQGFRRKKTFLNGRETVEDRPTSSSGRQTTYELTKLVESERSRRV